MTTQVVSYDVWRTLVRSNPKFGEQRSTLIIEALGWTGDPAKLAEIINSASKELDDRSDASGGTVQFGFVERVAYAASIAGLALPSETRLAELKAAVIEAHLALLPQFMEPDVLDVLRRHRNEGRKIAVISNTGMTEGETLQQMLDKMGVLQYVDYELYSDVLKMAKPDPKVFELLIRQSGVAAQEILHIGDNRIADYDGAVGAGLQALLYDRRNNATVPFITRHVDVFEHPLLTND